MSIEPSDFEVTPNTTQLEQAVAIAKEYKDLSVSCCITTPEAEIQAKLHWEQTKEFRKRVEEQRKEKIEPFRKFISIINDAAKQVTTPLEEAEDLIKQKITQYRTLLEIERQQELRAKEEAAKIIGSDAPVYVAPVDSVSREGGVIAYTKTEKKFKILEALEVPRQFLMVNEEAISLAIKQGCTEIPGIEIYEEKKTILRSR